MTNCKQGRKSQPKAKKRRRPQQDLNHDRVVATRNTFTTSSRGHRFTGSAKGTTERPTLLLLTIWGRIPRQHGTMKKKGLN